MRSAQRRRPSLRRMPARTPKARASYEQVMMQVPCSPLVTATGRPRHSGRSRCSMAAKKAFMSTRMMARDQGTADGWDMAGFLPVAAQLPDHHALDGDALRGIDHRRHSGVFRNEGDAAVRTLAQ